MNSIRILLFIARQKALTSIKPFSFLKFLIHLFNHLPPPKLGEGVEEVLYSHILQCGANNIIARQKALTSINSI